MYQTNQHEVVLGRNVVCNQILDQIKNSNLNFQLVESPYSSKISIKKTNVKIYPENISQFPNISFKYPPPGFPAHVPCQVPTGAPSDHNLHQNNTMDDPVVTKLMLLESEMIAVKSEKSESDKEIDSYRKTIQVLEEKLAHDEKVMYDLSNNSKKSENDKQEEIKVLKGVIKNKNDEIAKQKEDAKDFNKVLKGKEKEIHNLETKASNQEQNIAGLKQSNYDFKNEVKKLKKSIKQKQNEMNKTKTPTPTPPVYLCYICEKSSKRIEDMKKHVEQEHGNNAKEQDGNTNSDRTLEHKLSEYNNNNDNNILSCTMCGNKFAVIDHLVAHIHAYHNIPVTYSNPARRKPMIISSEFQCNFCEKSFPCAAQLSEHTKSEHVKSAISLDEDILDLSYETEKYSKIAEKTFNLDICNTSSKITIRYQRRHKDAQFSVRVKVKGKVRNSNYLVNLKTKWQYASQFTS